VISSGDLDQFVRQRVRGEGGRGAGFLVEHFGAFSFQRRQQLVNFDERGCQCRHTALGIAQLGLAIGQRGAPEALGETPIEVKDGRIVVDSERRTTLEGVWAGGDCIYGGQDLTVSAVEDGKQAARSIAAALGASRA